MHKALFIRFYHLVGFDNNCLKSAVVAVLSLRHSLAPQLNPTRILYRFSRLRCRSPYRASLQLWHGAGRRQRNRKNPPSMRITAHCGLNLVHLPPDVFPNFARWIYFLQDITENSKKRFYTDLNHLTTESSKRFPNS